MELKTGYKRTEAGIVPADWLDCTVGDLIKFEGGSQPDKSHFKQSWIPGYTRLIQIRDYKSNKYETYVPSKLVRRFCEESDIMIGRYGPPVFQILKGISGAYNVALIKATPASQINKEYAYYFLKQDSLFTFIDKLSQRSSGQTGVDLKELRAYPLSLPPTQAEQEAIAEALSDADALIESLDQLITKKRQIKQGAMQDLLTGKRRLPGFSEEWEAKRLAELADIRSGGTPSTTQPQFWDGEVMWCTPTDITALNGFKYLRNTSRTISAEGLKASSAEIIPTHSIVMTSRATIGECAINTVPMTTNQGFKNFVPFDNVDTEFLYYLLTTQRAGFIGLCSGSTFLEIGKTQLSGYQVQVPKTKLEQTAIATVLSDMDTELAALETRLAKARQIKQGMMQELLTGRIRLL
ncbi:restriction endonuclease subunit S [Comamonas aquatica]|jgi:type I restriction enzyme S subunit|uniref:restriction endonuclease subunit S n=1 Tax=Comamonas aquatica TaxID=225991 RepID=UPI002447D1B2|nr:restriction endonuclease subunit S [Comamonas aquatica]MDH1381039.1 restriction endonuclease subunit S [Comamonas aquatica]MDH1641085.1 restriction endonuclease subunit S [Comamonas aquatica]